MNCYPPKTSRLQMALFRLLLPTLWPCQKTTNLVSPRRVSRLSQHIIWFQYTCTNGIFNISRNIINQYRKATFDHVLTFMSKYALMILFSSEKNIRRTLGKSPSSQQFCLSFTRLDSLTPAYNSSSWEKKGLTPRVQSRENDDASVRACVRVWVCAPSWLLPATFVSAKKKRSD